MPCCCTPQVQELPPPATPRKALLLTVEPFDIPPSSSSPPRLISILPLKQSSRQGHLYSNGRNIGRGKPVTLDIPTCNPLPSLHATGTGERDGDRRGGAPGGASGPRARPRLCRPARALPILLGEAPARPSPRQGTSGAARFAPVHRDAQPVAEDSARHAIDNGVRQILVLGAGLDTFAYRLEPTDDLQCSSSIIRRPKPRSDAASPRRKSPNPRMSLMSPTISRAAA